MSGTVAPLLSVDGLSKQFDAPRRAFFAGAREPPVCAVTGVSFDLRLGETLGIVGESGSGKTTVARMLLRLVDPTSGQVRLRGREILTLPPGEVRSFLRPRIRMVFQDPDAALNPACTVGTGLAKAMRLYALTGAPRGLDALVAEVGMDRSFLGKYPDELSGGEKRRIGICRALLTNPDVIVADEPLSGLDVVWQERVLGLLKAEQTKRGFALILISHDLDRVNQSCDRVLVMHRGRVVEEAPVRRGPTGLAAAFVHPYGVLLQQAGAGVARGPSAADAGIDQRLSAPGSTPGDSPFMT